MKPQWPQFTKESNIKSWGYLFLRHATSISFPPELLKSTYSDLLTGIAQTIAANFDKQNPSCTFEQMREHVEKKASLIQIRI